MGVRRLYSFGSGKGKVAGCCEKGDEHLGFIKFTEFLASLNNYQPFHGAGHLITNLPAVYGPCEPGDKDGRSVSENRLGEKSLNLSSNKGKWTKNTKLGR
jgi:hypothetical protein